MEAFYSWKMNVGGFSKKVFSKIGGCCNWVKQFTVSNRFYNGDFPLVGNIEESRWQIDGSIMDYLWGLREIPLLGYFYLLIVVNR